MISKHLTEEGFTEADCLALVERSPAAVAVHDKAAWLALFARYNLVEDPVGSAPHITGVFDARSGFRSNGRLSRFYETFIAPNTIRFEVERDTVCGLHVVRDLTIEIAMAPEVVVRVPVHLLYELTVEAGELKIFRLAAHWELWPMLQQQIATGRHFMWVGGASALRMMRHQGVTGMAGFMRALSSVGAVGKAQADRFARHFNAGDTAQLKRLFAAADTLIAFPHAGRYLPVTDCARQGGELHFSKVLAAGNMVSATVNYRSPDGHCQGVVFFELDMRSLLIVALTFYWHSTPLQAAL
ncbi:MAG: hypothetical protein KDI33_04650 [Halioglobus sp.]|nr:hypothetical protein [Halioglobus sp.]